jgi:hypothetical protein
MVIKIIQVEQSRVEKGFLKQLFLSFSLHLASVTYVNFCSDPLREPCPECVNCIPSLRSRLLICRTMWGPGAIGLFLVQLHSQAQNSTLWFGTQWHFHLSLDMTVKNYNPQETPTWLSASTWGFAALLFKCRENLMPISRPCVALSGLCGCLEGSPLSLASGFGDRI